MAANMYRVGDYVFFENSSSNPYLIRRIEELNKTASGNVEAKVVCFYRRRDISQSLIQLADKHAKDLEEEKESPSEPELSEKQKHQLRHRELFLSRQYESLPATHIRGKCSVALLNETEAVLSYLEKEDTFFYSLVYDPTQKTLLADKGEIRVGPRFQADVPEMLQEGEPDDRDQSKLEMKMWDPECPLTNKQIDQFLVVARAVGTFARALDCSSSVRQPSLHMSAAAASRDITLFHAMDTLHRHGYDLSSALSVLVPQGGPVLCRDEMEEWSSSEANLFEEALEKYGKDFNDIRQDFLPWKSLTSIIEYYYMWKTTDRYVQQKRLKAAEAESKLKQVYIPTYNKPNPNQISVSNGKMATVNGAASTGSFHTAGGGRACESCFGVQSAQWYSWGPPNMQCRLCVSCWMYWKKYGGLKMPSRAEGAEEKTPPSPAPNELRSRGHGARQSSHMVPMRNSGSPKSSMKTKQAFLLQATRLTKLARHMCRDLIRLRRAARRPFVPINCGAIKAEYMMRVSEGMTGRPMKPKSSPRSTLTSVLQYLESRPATHVQRPHRTPGLQVQPPRRLLSSLPSHGPLGMLGKRSYHHHSRVESAERRAGAPGQENPAHIVGPILQHNGSGTGGSNLRASGLMLRKRRPNWIDAPDDSFFLVSRETRKARRLLSRSQLRRACRQPCEQISLRRVPQGPAQVPVLAPPHPSLRMRGPIVIHD
ncbi:metastasis-associated protein MTA3 isoform X2 [Ctenopharyngodon idella]|uniref:metastasis-associated protein MTA3-like isoform X2 n=1 Tax=Ctenopharyngodon idella TaxID=7959 RepID=UPI00223286DF|nr:metastasis-associated protein MTA3-like isoform X2 [Ctenopharyngodon idella]XP_051770584.1 metastasis-associated protein MTA3 isoform X2 [Ctenopharyngodon idella]